MVNIILFWYNAIYVQMLDYEVLIKSFYYFIWIRSVK